MPQLNILLIGSKNPGIDAPAELLQIHNDLMVTIMDSNECLSATTIPNINWIKETPVFYQPWNNRLITLEGNVHDYDYLILAPQSNNSCFMQQSLLTDRNGMIDINKETLQHERYNNIFAFNNITEECLDGSQRMNIIAKQIGLSIKSIIKGFLPGTSYLLHMVLDETNSYQWSSLIA